MKVNKSLLAILSIFLILLIFISSASASDVNETQVLSVDDSANIGEDNIVNNINDAGSFDHLQLLINNNKIVNLTKDYQAVGANGRVHINSYKIINGNGYTLNGNEKTGI